MNDDFLTHFVGELNTCNSAKSVVTNTLAMWHQGLRKRCDRYDAIGNKTSLPRITKWGGIGIMAFCFPMASNSLTVLSAESQPSSSSWELQLVFPEAYFDPIIDPLSAPLSTNAHHFPALDDDVRHDIQPTPTVWPATQYELNPHLHRDSSAAPKHSWFQGSIAYGVYPANKQYPFGQPFETFRGNWGSLHLNTEQGIAANQVPPALTLALAYPFTEHLFAYARASLKRDIRSWHADALGNNWPHSTDEVDLNEPSLGYLVADASWGRLLLGRFPAHMGPSPEFSLLLSASKPYYDGAMASLKAPAVRYHFFIASLNTWLQGTPPGDTASENYPVGSEAWRQTHYTQSIAENAHLRVYDAKAKTLTIHRLEWLLGNARENKPSAWGAVLGLSEMQVIGGKTPDFLDVEPFTVWHNDFKNGYTNTLTHLDARLNLPYGVTLFGELAMDDLPYAPKEGKKQKAILGQLFGGEKTLRIGASALRQRIHFILTDPKLYRFTQPYNTFSARQVLSTNEQPTSDPAFIDRFVIDYPVGYFRGGDARDLWYSALWVMPRRGWLRHGGQCETHLAYLQHGESDDLTPAQAIAENATTPTGTMLEEWRESLQMTIGLPKGWQTSVGLGANQWAKGNASGSHFWAQAGLVWRWGAN